ncbi:hypothetical protein ILYODFUR_028192 [Ilyodon furcidens]|uniref:Uncharacterized protein n=1 Tax=Ilyodon furcidens TaxID=33524 RepID=A0ABV0TNJ2_9TELE
MLCATNCTAAAGRQNCRSCTAMKGKEIPKPSSKVFVSCQLKPDKHFRLAEKMCFAQDCTTNCKQLEIQINTGSSAQQCSAIVLMKRDLHFC